MAGASESARPDERTWEDLFDFLDPERRARSGPDRDDQAQARYAEITRKLVCFFAGRGCRDAEDLAAETMLRVSAKCRQVDTSGHADCLGYFFGVARNVHHEWIRHELRESAFRETLKQEMTRLPPIDVETWKGREAVHRCLDRCLDRLTARARRLIVAYYRDEGAAKAEGHARLAGEFGKTPNALRIEVHRIRKNLRLWVLGCLQSHAQPAASGAAPPPLAPTT
jgi:RNA polymerase sigma factor (sigma-70 family)